MIALVMTLILIQVLQGFGDNFSLNQEKTAVRLQAKRVVNDLGLAFKYAHTLEEDNNYTINYAIPLISLSSAQSQGKPALASCDIKVDPVEDQISLTIDQNHYPRLGETETISETIPYAGNHDLNTGCGSLLAIRKIGS